MFYNKNNSEIKQRFGIRKLTIGTCSVLLSTLFLTMGINQTVHAADVNNDTDTTTEAFAKNQTSGEETKNNFNGKDQATVNIKPNQNTTAQPSTSENNSETKDVDGAKKIDNNIQSGRNDNTSESTQSQNIVNNSNSKNDESLVTNSKEKATKDVTNTANKQISSVEYETRTATVNYVYGTDVKDTEGNVIHVKGSQMEYTDGKLVPPAVLDVYYKRNVTKDAVTGATLQTGNWTWDSSYNEDDYKNGYKIVSGTWTSLPTEWAPVVAGVPTIDGYTYSTENSETKVPTNEFVFPTYVHGGTSNSSDNETAYTDDADTYEARPVHTVMYFPTTATQKYQFVNASDNDAAIGDPIYVSGNSDKSVEIPAGTFKIPAGYILKPGTTLPTSITLTANSHTINIPLVAAKTVAIEYVDPEGKVVKTVSQEGAVGESINLNILSRLSVNVDTPVDGFSSLPYNLAPTEYQKETINNNKVAYTVTDADNQTIKIKVYQPHMNIVYWNDTTKKEVTSHYFINSPSYGVNGYDPRIMFPKDFEMGNYTCVGVTGAPAGLQIVGSYGTPLDTYDSTSWSIPNFNLESGYDENEVDYQLSLPTTQLVFHLAQKAQQTYQFVDADENNSKVGEPVTVKGIVGEVDKINLTIPENYELEPDYTLPTSATLAANNSTIYIHLVHKRVTYDPNKDTTVPEGIDASQTVQTRTITENFVKTDADGNAIGQAAESIQAEVYYVRSATKDLVTNEVTYGDWTWNTKAGDKSTPGIKILSGDTTLWKIPTGSSSWGINPPTIADYTVVTNSQDGSFDTTQLSNPNSDAETIFTNSDASTAIAQRNNITTYYVPTSALSKSITRTINAYVDGSTTPKYTQTQTASFTREARVNLDDTGIVLGIANPLYGIDSDVKSPFSVGSWSSANGSNQYWDDLDLTANTIPNVPKGYVPTINSKIVWSVPQVTVTPDTEDTTVNIYYIKQVANIGLSGHYKMSYNGSAAKIPEDVISQVTETLADNLEQYGIALPDMSKLSLTASDFSFADDNGNITNAPTNVGTYHIILNENGLNKFKDVDSLFTWDYDPKTAYATFVINKATPKIAIDYVASKTYNGTPIAGYSPTVTITVGGDSQYAIHLIDGDFEFRLAGTTDDWTTVAPSNVGTYDVQLTATGLKKITGDDSDWTKNINWSNVTLTSPTTTGQYVINKAKATITLPADSSQTVAWTGSTPTINPNDFIPTISTTNKNQANIALPSNVKFTASDYEIVDAAGKAISPTNIGTYKIRLTNSGWQKIKNAVSGNANYDWNYEGMGTLTITKATATVNLSGTGSAMYTGSAIVLNNDNLGTIKVTLSNGETYNVKPSDLQFVGEAPVNVGNNYKIKLSSEGLANITQLDTDHYNYQYDNSQASFEVTKATATYQLTGVQSKIYDGKPARLIADGDYKVNIATKNGQQLGFDLTNDDIEFDTTDNIAPTNYGVYKVKLTDVGVQKLKALSSNYDWNAENSIATYDIKQAKMTVNVTGTADTVYNGKEQPLTAEQLAKLALTWSGSETVPQGINSVELSSSDIEYLEKQADGTWKVMDNAPLHAIEEGKSPYGIRLTQSGLEKIQEANKNGNYIFVLGDEVQATYTINQLKAQVTLKGYQSAPYTKNGVLNLTQFTVWLTNVANGTPINVSDNPYGNHKFEDGDLVIEGYDAGTYPSDVGDYTVKMTDQLIDALRKLFPDYNFDAYDKDESTDTTIDSFAKSNSPISSSTASDVVAANNNGKYIITPIDAFIKLTGHQTIKYGENDTLNINAGGQNGYAITLTDTYGNVINGFTLTPDDLEFVTKNYNIVDPKNVGNYEVTLTPTAMEKINAIGKNSLGNMNYSWINQFTPATFTVEQMPVTITISDKSTDSHPTIIYGQPLTLNPSDYSISVKTENGETLDYTLQDGDLAFADGTPTVAGTYKVVLSPVGLKNIEDKFGTQNYSYTNSGNGLFTITTGKPSVALSGADTQVYNGKAISDYTVTARVTGPDTDQTVTLTGSDLEYVNTKGNVSTTAPVDAGNYTVQLSQAGKDKIATVNNGNLDWSNFKWNNLGSPTYTITKATAIVTVDGCQSVCFNGQPAVIDWSKYAPTLSTNNGLMMTIPTSDLTASDYEITDANGNAVTDPTNAGIYTVKLTDAGLEKIESQTNNYDWKSTGFGTLIIEQVTPSVTINASDSKVYDGTAIDGYAPKVTITAPGVKKVTLTSGDFEFRLVGSTDGWTTEAPVNAGDYNVQLTQAGIHKIKMANPTNYDWSKLTPAVEGNYTIRKATITADFIGNQTKQYDGQSQNYDVKGSVTLITDNGLTITVPELNNSDLSYNPATHVNVGTYQVQLTQAALNKILASAGSQNYNAVFGKNNATLTIISENDLNKTVTRTINVIKPGKQTITTKQVAKLTRSATVDGITGKVVRYSDWKLITNEWTKITVPKVAGYTPVISPKDSDLNAVIPNGNTKDVIINITYIPNSQTGKISYVDGDSREISSTPLTGKTDETIPVNYEDGVPAGWKVVPGQDIPTSETATADGIPTVTIKIEHKIVEVTPNDPKTPKDKLPQVPSKDYPDGDNYPEGVSENNLNKTVIRTINVAHPDGTVTTVEQKTKFERTATVDLVTGKITYTDWKQVGGNGWITYIPTPIDGYTIPNVPGEDVTAVTADTTVNISYSKNETPTPTPALETQQSTHTIIYVDGNGKEISRQIISGTAGSSIPFKPSYPSDWKPAEGQSIPDSVTMNGGVTKITVVSDKGTETTTRPTLDKPGNNEKTAISVTPEKPAQPNKSNKNKPANPNVPAKNTPVTVARSKATGWKFARKVISGQKTKQKSNEKTLPQTGEQDNAWIAAIGGLVAGLGIFGLAVDRRKKNNKD